MSYCGCPSCRARTRREADAEQVRRAAEEAARWFETARRVTGDTETGPREDGEEYVRLRKGHPEWVRDLVYDAHDSGEMLPDDWRYACIRAAVEWIAEGRDADESYDDHDFADGQVDVYTAPRIAWLASHLRRVGYVDDAVNDLGYRDVVAAIGYGQYGEALMVLGSVASSLERRAEYVEEQEERAEEYLDDAQRRHPLDLAARAVYMVERRDTTDGDESDAWRRAIERMRNGT